MVQNEQTKLDAEDKDSMDGKEGTTAVKITDNSICRRDSKCICSICRNSVEESSNLVNKVNLVSEVQKTKLKSLEQNLFSDQTTLIDLMQTEVRNQEVRNQAENKEDKSNNV